MAAAAAVPDASTGRWPGAGTSSKRFHPSHSQSLFAWGEATGVEALVSKRDKFIRVLHHRARQRLCRGAAAGEAKQAGEMEKALGEKAVQPLNNRSINLHIGVQTVALVGI